MGYHYGITIKKYRELRGISQAQLAARWPKPDGEEGANTRYVQEIEYGRKKIADTNTLRSLSTLLDIPLWEFGMSDYNPFNPAALPGRGMRMFDETLDTAEMLVRQTWALRQSALLGEARDTVKRLSDLFHYFHTELPPPLRLETRFLCLYADVLAIRGVMCIDAKQYAEAQGFYARMHETATQVGDATVLAHALMNRGVEADRAGQHDEAVELLELARDYSFETSKGYSSLIYSYLSRAYARQGDASRFLRANDTAQRLSSHLKEDFTFYSLSNVLAERSYGYLKVGQPHQALAMKAEIERQIEQDQNTRVGIWLLMDWARASLQLGDIEESMKAAREFARRAQAMQSAHALSQTDTFLKEVVQTGYGEVQEVKAFREELLHL